MLQMTGRKMDDGNFCLRKRCSANYEIAKLRRFNNLRERCERRDTKCKQRSFFPSLLMNAPSNGWSEEGFGWKSGDWMHPSAHTPYQWLLHWVYNWQSIDCITLMALLLIHPSPTLSVSVCICDALSLSLSLLLSFFLLETSVVSRV